MSGCALIAGIDDFSTPIEVSAQTDANQRTPPDAAVKETSVSAGDSNWAPEASSDAATSPDVVEESAAEGCTLLRDVGASATCVVCTTLYCCPDFNACAKDSDCLALMQCYVACHDTTCSDQCTATHSGSVTTAAPVLGCTQSHCPTQCPGAS